MRFEESPFLSQFKPKKLHIQFGKLFLLEDFFIMEIDEGVHFDWNKLNVILEILRDHYGTHKKLAYIANRVHSYSIDPMLWSYFDKDDSILIAGSIVSYRESTMMNATLEKQLSQISLKRASSLNEAINWTMALSELS